MGNDVNRGIIGDSENISTIINTDTFINLDSNLQNKIIDTVYTSKDKDGGVMGKLLGTKPTNSSIHIGFILSVLLILILIVDFVHSYIVNESINMDLVNIIIPVITLYLGYILGKGSN